MRHHQESHRESTPTQRHYTPLTIVLLLLVVGAGLGGCGKDAIEASVTRLEERPASYADRNVRVQGVVTRHLRASNGDEPMHYVVRDRASERDITIVPALEKVELPELGEVVAVEGKVERAPAAGRREAATPLLLRQHSSSGNVTTEPLVFWSALAAGAVLLSGLAWLLHSMRSPKNGHAYVRNGHAHALKPRDGRL